MSLSFLPRLLLLATALAAAPPDFPPVFQGELKFIGQHPRLVFRNRAKKGFGRTFDQVRRLNRDDATFRAIFAKALEAQPRDRHPAMLAAC